MVARLGATLIRRIYGAAWCCGLRRIPLLRRRVDAGLWTSHEGVGFFSAIHHREHFATFRKKRELIVFISNCL